MNWQRCFIFHRLSLESRKQNKSSPVWLDGDRITAAASGSIDKANVLVDKGEMSFELFSFDKVTIEGLIDKKMRPLAKLKELSVILGEGCVPGYLIYCKCDKQ